MKQKITVADAVQIMFDTLDEMDLGDKIYAFTQDLFKSHIQYIEDNFDVDEQTLDNDEKWYDGFYEKFHQAVYDAMVKFLKTKQ